MVYVILSELRAACSMTVYDGSEGVCQWCAQSLSVARRTVFCSDKCRRAWEQNHVWRKARTAARRRDKYVCVKCGEGKTTTKIEVNHITPMNGVNYNIPSCNHHQNNLETLCVKHHKEETKKQAGERARLRKEGKSTDD